MVLSSAILTRYEPIQIFSAFSSRRDSLHPTNKASVFCVSGHVFAERMSLDCPIHLLHFFVFLGHPNSIYKADLKIYADKVILSLDHFEQSINGQNFSIKLT